MIKLRSLKAADSIHTTGDAFLEILMSGHNKNIINTTIVASTLGSKEIGLTGGELLLIVEVIIKASETKKRYVSEIAFTNLSLFTLNAWNWFFWKTCWYVRYGTIGKDGT